MTALRHLADLAGLGAPPFTGAVFAVLWLAPMLACSPLADWLARRVFTDTPRLGAFRGLKESHARLIVGIAIAWVLGGFIEELLLRGVALQAVAFVTRPAVGVAGGETLGILAAAALAYVLHLYQGRRAAFIVSQLSVLFGLLFVISGNNLWAAILCHGLYDTIAFIRFATGKSRYSKFDGSSAE
ncbi:MAG TPA: CPBP family glutamic-type intramembrane protease [Rhizomicrobium sp.]|nr:CPBP family glutamic-type intramembrane protease [Rhizomicrobium sp.]